MSIRPNNAPLLVGMIALSTVGCASTNGTDRNHDAPHRRASHSPAKHQFEHPLQTAIEKTEALTENKAVYLASGVAFVDLKPGRGATLQEADQVVAHYTGWLLDGTRFESSHDRGRPGQFSPSDLVAGCAEGMLSMRVGGKRKVFVPASLGYGQARRPSAIPPDAPLIFEFELLEIK